MNVGYHRNFKKNYDSLNIIRKENFKERLDLFIKNRNDPVLKDKPLKAEWKGYRSFRVTGDIRAIYKILQDGSYFFVAVGTHSQLFKKY